MKNYYEKGREEYVAGNYYEAFNLYNQGFNNGDVKCAYGLARCYLNGDGTSQNNYKANELFENYFQDILSLAQSGDAEAQIIISYYSFNGFCVEKDVETAIDWAEEAASNDYIYAYIFLADKYQNGVGVEKSINKAIKYYNKAINCDESIYYAGVALAKNLKAEITGTNQNTPTQQTSSVESMAEKIYLENIKAGMSPLEAARNIRFAAKQMYKDEKKKR